MEAQLRQTIFLESHDIEVSSVSAFMLGWGKPWTAQTIRAT
jgi:hypothetical protein